MRNKHHMLFLLLMLLMLFVALGVAAEEQNYITVTVRGSELTNGVVVVDLLKNGKACELQCNDGAGACTALKSGTYRLVELPKNYGMYECKNVDLYLNVPVDIEKTEKVGEYCLIEKAIH